MSNSEYFIYTTKVDEKTHYYVSPLPQDIGFEIGLTSEALMGELLDGPEKIDPQSFSQNNIFLKLLSVVIMKHLRDSPSAKQICEQNEEGKFFYMDKRAVGKESEASEEDVIAALDVQDHEIIEISLNDKYRVLTEDGFMELDSYLHEKLIEEIVAVVEEKNPK